MNKSLCQNCFDADESIFKNLPADAVEFLKQNHTCISYKKTEIIFKQGDKPSGLVCLANGKVKIYKEGIGGREHIIRLTKTFHFIGFRALFANEHYKASAVALEDSVICIISKEALYKVLEENALLAIKFIHLLATELGSSNLKTITLTQKHVRGRLAEAIIQLIDIYGINKTTKAINVQLPREDLAQLSSMTASNAIRTLASFVNEGIISLEGKNIIVHDLEGLNKISEQG